MTFLEAAIEVLRREGKPLPVRRLAELAVQQNLLSVVGRDPESTMQARLAEVLDKGPAHAELMRVRPDLYGLRAYPDRPYPPVREGATPETAADEGADEEHDEELDGPAEAAPAEGQGGGRRRRRRRGRGGDRPELAAVPANGTLEGLEVTAAAAPTSDETAAEQAVADLTEGEEGEFEVEADAASAAPLMVATPGEEEMTRTGEEREVRSEIHGRRDREDRGRHRHERGKDRPRSGDRPAQQAQQQQQPRPTTPTQAPSSSPAPIAATGARTLSTDLYDLLRAQDGRPQHARALAQEVERKKILDGRPHPEIVREVRMALHGEGGQRAHKGLRPRFRSLGGGNYAAIDRKLDEELLHAERALEAALDRAHVAAVSAVRRRLSKLSPFSFEQLGRLCAEAIGVERAQLVKRGDGVCYYGGERNLGAFRSRVLVGIRPGEAELGRRAVGELRAGLDARGYDEGFLFALGRLSGDAREELRAGRAVTVYDGDSIGTFLVDRKLGVRLHHAPIPYVDVDFFAELNET